MPRHKNNHSGPATDRKNWLSMLRVQDANRYAAVIQMREYLRHLEGAVRGEMLNDPKTQSILQAEETVIRARMS